MKYVLCVDFGSTYTKLTAIDAHDKRILATSRAFTTISTHVLDGFNAALKELEKKTGNIDYDFKLAASSAAGGLKMVAVGLVPSLTANAAKMAANSAGAKVVGTFSYELSDMEQKEIYDKNPDIVLLSGGIDGGNKEVILANAKTLSEIERDFPIIVAGNKSAAKEAAGIIEKSGKKAIIVENVMPRFNELNIMPAKTAIRDLFIERIIDAKGLTDAQNIMNMEIIPTPLAAFEACELLSSIGSVMAVDVGGATTDVYSMADGLPSRPSVLEKGLKEPFAKRTVEGDLGVRYSMQSLISEAEIEKIAQNSGVYVELIEEWLTVCNKDQSIIAEKNSPESKIDDELAASCVEIAMSRHCGFYETAYTPMGEVMIQTGKDLSNVKYMIGTGGSVINSNEAEKIMQRAVYRPQDLNLLKPQNPQIIIDRKNILTAVGLLSRIDKDCALCIMKNEFQI